MLLYHFYLKLHEFYLKKETEKLLMCVYLILYFYWERFFYLSLVTKAWLFQLYPA